MGVWSYDFVEAQTHDGPQAQAHCRIASDPPTVNPLFLAVSGSRICAGDKTNCKGQEVALPDVD